MCNNEKPLSLLLALCLLSGLCAVAEPAAPLPLKDGVHWGMSSSGFAAAYGVSQSGTAISENARVTTSFFSGDSFLGAGTLAGGFFIDDRLVCIGWDNIPESYAAICAQFTDVCGPATEYGSEHFSALMDTLSFSLDVYTSHGFAGWQFRDGTYLAVFHYSETDLGVMYADEALMKLLLSDDSDTAAGETETTVMLSGDAIPWGSSAETVIREMALKDYSDSSRNDVYFVSIDNSGEYISYVFIHDQLVCVTYDYGGSEPLHTYDELLAEASSRSGEPTPNCGERILSIMNVLALGLYSSAEEFSDTCGWELTDGSFMSLCRYNDGESFALMITNEAMLSSLAAE